MCSGPVTCVTAVASFLGSTLRRSPSLSVVRGVARTGFLSTGSTVSVEAALDSVTVATAGLVPCLLSAGAGSCPGVAAGLAARSLLFDGAELMPEVPGSDALSTLAASGPDVTLIFFLTTLLRARDCRPERRHSRAPSSSMLIPPTVGDFCWSCS